MALLNLKQWHKDATDHLNLILNSGVVVDYVSILNEELQKLKGYPVLSVIDAKRVIDLVATLSPCAKRKVACLIIRDFHIVAVGVNHNPGSFNCELDADSTITRDTTVHAEQHAFSQIGDASNTALISNYEPCILCAPDIHQRGVVNVLSFERGNPTNPENLGFQILAGLGVPCGIFSESLV